MQLGEFNRELVECLVCKAQMKNVVRHVKKHDLTVEQYRAKFPGVAIRSQTSRELRSALFSKRTVSKEQKAQISKTLKQYSKDNPGAFAKSAEHRRKIGKGVAEFAKNNPDAHSSWVTPEAREKLRVLTKARMADPEERERISESHKQYCVEHPGCRDRTSESVEKQKATLKAGLNTPEGIAWRKERSRIATEIGKRRYEENPASFESFIDAGSKACKWNDTVPEQKFAAILDGMGLEYIPQYRVKGLGGRYDGSHRWDFMIPSLKTLVEVDGCFWHLCPKCNISTGESAFMEGIRKAKSKEMQRDVRAEQAGWRVLRFWEHELFSDIEGIIDAMVA